MPRLLAFLLVALCAGAVSACGGPYTSSTSVIEPRPTSTLSTTSSASATFTPATIMTEPATVLPVATAAPTLAPLTAGQAATLESQAGPGYGSPARSVGGAYDGFPTPGFLAGTGWGEYEHGPTNLPVVALTFDAGGTGIYAQQLLDILTSHHVQATFFVTGRFVLSNPQIVREMAADHFQIANHTEDHYNLENLTDAQIRAELDQVNQQIQTLTGVNTKPFFRPPYGARDDRVLSVAATDGYRSIYWTADTLDWMASSTPASVLARAVAGMTPGAIFLEHVGAPQSIVALPTILSDLQARHLQPVTVDQLVADGGA